LTNESKKSPLAKAQTADESAAAKKKKKGLTSPPITLIMPDESVTSESLEHAERLASRRNLKLVKILDFDTKTERPIYRLMTNLEFFEEASKAKTLKRKERDSDLKEEKLFIISAKIGDHDLSVKISQMLKLIKKKHGIRIFISQDGNPTKAENIVEVIEEELKELAEKKNQVKKGTSLKILYTPKLQQNVVDSSEDKNDSKSDTKNPEAEKKKAGNVRN